MVFTDKLDPILCNVGGHTTNNDGVCLGWSLHLEDSCNVQTVSGMVHSLWIQWEDF